MPDRVFVPRKGSRSKTADPPCKWNSSQRSIYAIKAYLKAMERAAVEAAPTNIDKTYILRRLMDNMQALDWFGRVCTEVPSRAYVLDYLEANARTGEKWNATYDVLDRLCQLKKIWSDDQRAITKIRLLEEINGIVNPFHILHQPEPPNNSAD
jgi:hypothetical protein